MAGISGVIITHNEARNIGRCIASLEGVADEVVVVDAESSDGTRAIAEGLGARVSVRPWTNYSDQKNHANSLASNPYILSLDADEALSPELTASLLEAERKGLHGAYRFNRLTNYCGIWVRHGGWYPDTKMRLFPKEGTRWEGEHVHEELRLAPGTRVTKLDGDLLHWSYYSIEDHMARMDRYSELGARKMFAAGRKVGYMKRWLSPVFKFTQGYLLRLGLLDGATGFRLAWYAARAVRLKYEKLDRLRQAGSGR